MSEPNPYLKYSGLAFQMLGPIVGGVYLGQFLDERYCQAEECVLFTIIFSLFGTVVGLYLALKDFMTK